MSAVLQMHVCALRLIEGGKISILEIVQIDSIFAAERKRRNYHFCEDLNRLIHINFGGLRWNAGYHFSKKREKGLLTISQRVLQKKFKRVWQCSQP